MYIDTFEYCCSTPELEYSSTRVLEYSRLYCTRVPVLFQSCHYRYPILYAPWYSSTPGIKSRTRQPRTPQQLFNIDTAVPLYFSSTRVLGYSVLVQYYRSCTTVPTYLSTQVLEYFEYSIDLVQLYSIDSVVQLYWSTRVLEYSSSVLVSPKSSGPKFSMPAFNSVWLIILYYTTHTIITFL